MSTVKADALQPTIAGNNLILKTGSGDVERIRIDPVGQVTFASTTGTTFSGQVNFANATRFPGGIGVGGGFAGSPSTALDVVHTNTALSDPGVNNYNSTKGRSNLSVRGSGTNTTLFIGNSSSSAVWLQVQNSDNNQYSLSLQPVGGNVGIGTTGPAVALDVVGAARSSTSTTSSSNAKTLTTKDYVDSTTRVGAMIMGSSYTNYDMFVGWTVESVGGYNGGSYRLTPPSGTTWLVMINYRNSSSQTVWTGGYLTSITTFPNNLTGTDQQTLFAIRTA